MVTDPDPDTTPRGTVAVAAGTPGTSHIAYPGSSPNGLALRHAIRSEGSWRWESIFVGIAPDGAEIDDIDMVPDAAGGVQVLDMDIIGQPFAARVALWTKVDDLWTVDWFEQSKTSTIGSQVAVALAPSGALNVLYCENDSNALYRATDESGEWVSEVVGEGFAGDIAVDDSGFVHATYAVRDGGALPSRYLTNESGEWIATSIDAGLQSAIALANSGPVHVVSLSGDDVLHTWTNGVGWQTETVDVAPHAIRCMRIDLAVDERGALHVTYAAGDGPCEIRYATNESGTWATETLSGDSIDMYDASGSPITIGGGKVHLVYADPDIEYATHDLPNGADDDCDGVPY